MRTLTIIFGLVVSWQALANCSLLDSLEQLEDAKLALSGSSSTNSNMVQRILREQERIIDEYIDALEGMSKTKKGAMESHLASTNKVIRDAKALLDDVPEVRYTNPGHHDVSQAGGAFRGGGDMTSHLPQNHTDLFDKAIPYRTENGKTSFWVCTAVGVYHRFQGSLEQGALLLHWNGSSVGGRAIRRRDIPISVRRYWGGRADSCR